MSENNDASNESSGLGGKESRPVVVEGATADSAGDAGSGEMASAARSGVLRPSVLRQSVLGTGAPIISTTTSDEPNADANDVSKEKVKNEVVLNNPFMKEQCVEDDTEVDNVSSTSDEAKKRKSTATPIAAAKTPAKATATATAAATATATATSKATATPKAKATDGKKPQSEDEADERPDPLTLLRKNGLERSNLFAAAKSSIPLVEKSGFVFGQNVHERVVGENINPESSDSVSTSGELLFSSVIQNAAKSNENNGAKEASKEVDAKSLTDVAREYEESRAQKRKYEEVETFTGEENEINIVDVTCKMFAFVNSNWEERGRGSLRLNDSKNEQECSRVVFRTSGNLRLLLNTKVWAGMVAERASQKSLRLTAMDNTGKIKIFLLMARPSDISQLHKALTERIRLRKVSHPEEIRAVIAGESKSCAAESASEVAEAAAAAVPEHDEAGEPGVKKPLLVETATVG